MQLTDLLSKYWTDAEARDRFHEFAHAELSRLAGACLKSVGPGRALDTQALIGEAYLRLFGGAEVRWESRVHFYSFMYRTMKNVLIDQHRRQMAAKRGGGVLHFPVKESDNVAHDPLAENILVLDLLEGFARESSLTARITGLVLCEQQTLPEVVEILKREEGSKLTLRDVEKHWHYAEAQLQRRLMERRRGGA